MAGLTLVLLAVGVALLVQRDVLQGWHSSSVVRGSGVDAVQTRDLARFSSIDLAGTNNVTVRVGGEQSVVVRADDNLLRRITTRVRAGSLVIGNTGFTTKSPMSVEVSVPSLEALTLSGSGVITAEKIQGQRLTLTLSGSGVLRASGTVTHLDVSLGGSGALQLRQLVARDVRAVMNGSGRILVDATNSLDASVPGSGVIIYGGNPAHVTTSVTGSGAVTRG